MVRPAPPSAPSTRSAGGAGRRLGSRCAAGLERREVDEVAEQRQQPAARAETVSRLSRCSASRGVPSVSSVSSRTWFIGVNSSCETFARNWLFSRLASSAASLASLSSRVRCLSVMSRKVATIRRPGAQQVGHRQRPSGGARRRRGACGPRPRRPSPRRSAAGRLDRPRSSSWISGASVPAEPLLGAEAQAPASATG